MAEKTENAQVEVRENEAQLRAFYLGKFKSDDKVPGSSLTIAEAREKHAEQVKADADKLAKRTEAYYARQETRGKTGRPTPDTAAVTTTVVTPVTELVDVKIAPPNPADEAFVEAVSDGLPAPEGGDDVYSFYTEEQLKKLPAPKKPALIAIAVRTGITPAPDDKTNDEIVDMILKQQEKNKPSA